jgi:hypothetical protein
MIHDCSNSLLKKLKQLFHHACFKALIERKKGGRWTRERKTREMRVRR